MSEIVTFVDENGDKHWTAAGSKAHEKHLAAPPPRPARVRTAKATRTTPAAPEPVED